MEYEVIDIMLIDESLDSYHEMLRGHQGKPYYIPSKKEFLAYDNPFYCEDTPEAAAFRNFLLSKTTLQEDMMDAVFTDIYCGVRCMNAGFQEVMNRLNDVGVAFNSKSDVNAFFEVYTAFHNRVRMQCNRGHTPDELFALLPRMNASRNSSPLVRTSVRQSQMAP